MPLFVTLATPQLSAAVGVPKLTPVAVHPVLVVAVTLDGHVIVGFIDSVTVIVCEQVAVLPDPSVTVQMTVVVPTEYVVDGWSLVTLATLQLS